MQDLIANSSLLEEVLVWDFSDKVKNNSSSDSTRKLGDRFRDLGPEETAIKVTSGREKGKREITRLRTLDFKKTDFI